MTDNTINNSQWQVYDGGQSYVFSNQTKVELPDYFTPNALVTLTVDTNCSTTKRLGDDSTYMQQKQNCASGAALPTTVPIITSTPLLYPNPSNGVYNCMLNGSVAKADEIIVNNIEGINIASFKNASQFDISMLPAGVYFYS